MSARTVAFFTSREAKLVALFVVGIPVNAVLSFALLLGVSKLWLMAGQSLPLNWVFYPAWFVCWLITDRAMVVPTTRAIRGFASQ